MKSQLSALLTLGGAVTLAERELRRISVFDVKASVPHESEKRYINLLGSTDGLTFEAFVIRKLVPNLWQGATVVWDNSSIHKGEEIEQAIVNAGAKLIYLPPYSPDFNPIENFWSKVKNTLRSIGARTYQALDLAIAEAFSQVSLKDIRNWFAHSCYCTSPI